MENLIDQNISIQSLLSVLQNSVEDCPIIDSPNQHPNPPSLLMQRWLMLVWCWSTCLECVRWCGMTSSCWRGANVIRWCGVDMSPTGDVIWWCQRLCLLGFGPPPGHDLSWTQSRSVLLMGFLHRVNLDLVILDLIWPRLWPGLVPFYLMGYRYKSNLTWFPTWPEWPSGSSSSPDGWSHSFCDSRYDTAGSLSAVGP